MQDANSFLIKDKNIMVANVIRINKLVFLFLGFIGVLIVYFLINLNPVAMSSQHTSSKLHKRITWHNQAFLDVPADVVEAAKSVIVNSEEIEMVYESMNIVISTKETVPKKLPTVEVLLLHGAAFSAQNWQDIGTLQFLAAAGYQAVAIDLPGKGKSTSISVRDSGDFLDKVIDLLDMNNPVIISPSMSGMYSLPFLLDSVGKRLKSSIGYVPVAPVYTEKYTKQQYNKLKIPTMIVCGSLDVNLGPISTENLKQLPNSEVFILEGAGHPAYMTHTEAFHRLLYNFLLSIASSQNQETGER